MHLEPCLIKEIYQEYKDDKEFSGESILGPSEFSELWRKCFRHVKIREFKAVTGKMVVIIMPLTI